MNASARTKSGAGDQHPRGDAQAPTHQELLALAARIVRENPLGVLTTVDIWGAPRARWMAAAPMGEGLRKLYSLSGGNAAKLRHIATNPAVCWIFNSPGHRDVVTIFGHAAILPSLRQVEPAWDRLMEATRDYSMNALSDTSNSAYCGIETAIGRVELLSPRLGIYTPRLVPLEGAASGGAPSPITRELQP